jgi:hypothetical protein
MWTRHITPARAVIVAGGALLLAFLISQVWASGDDPVFWGGVFVGASLAVITAFVIGRWLGGWLAVRLGRDRKIGQGLGVAAIGLLLSVAIQLWN